MPTPSSPFDNHLLAALGRVEWQRMQPHVERVDLARNQPIYAPGETMSHAYFPTTALASMMNVTETGACAESAMVGNDGMLGVSLFMSGGPTCGCALVLAAGEAWRIPACILRHEFNRAGSTMRILLRYTQALLTQTAQRAICMRHHLITQQVAVCLLQQADRSSSAEVLMTQEQIAVRLGVRREGVTEGAGTLQKLGLIRYARGHVEVLDREGLEDQACECYAVLRDEYHRLLPVAACQQCLEAVA
ncbi:Crp/Fnr family transcriptional regulator [Hydrogenophaga sp. Root209]|uniref:Crp/Fnr family transcriptional regulator n=1 Tax=unclassified Hydrogenophaga TaxID=2610897 RepID=UPI0006FACAF6|nr:Crp/Fnr family transcriptional regulator [Hydrogenophaga sp. Root209]KRC00456.1 Crp/Fnr family transcriptional regulator [Hydrogenophaga sp. Root209]